jgi:hypothetical protein
MLLERESEKWLTSEAVTREALKSAEQVRAVVAWCRHRAWCTDPD